MAQPDGRDKVLRRQDAQAPGWPKTRKRAGHGSGSARAQEVANVAAGRSGCYRLGRKEKSGAASQARNAGPRAKRDACANAQGTAAAAAKARAKKCGHLDAPRRVAGPGVEEQSPAQ